MSQPRSSRQAAGSEAKRGTVGLTMPVPPGMFSESPSSHLPRIVRESAGIHDVTLVNRPCQADFGGNLYISFFVVLSSFFVVILQLGSAWGAILGDIIGQLGPILGRFSIRGGFSVYSSVARG